MWSADPEIPKPSKNSTKAKSTFIVTLMWSFAPFFCIGVYTHGIETVVGKMAGPVSMKSDSSSGIAFFFLDVSFQFGRRKEATTKKKKCQPQYSIERTHVFNIVCDKTGSRHKAACVHTNMWWFP